MTEPKRIHEALADVMASVQAVRKADRNAAQNFNFRGIDSVVNAVGPALREHGVVVVPMVEQYSHRDVQTSTGKASRECTVQVRYRFYGPAGDYVDAVSVGEAMDSGDKGTPKAMSVAFRVALLQALCIPTDEPDPDAQVYERAGRGGRAVVVTDPQWLSEMQTLADESATAEALRAVWESVVAEHSAGRVSDDDRRALSQRITARLAALQAEAAPAEGDAA